MTERFVYYAERDGLIKIGTSAQPLYRARELRAALLGVEPGGRKPGPYLQERARHREFAHLRAHGEWFRFGPDLIAHIKTLPCPTYGPVVRSHAPSASYIEVAS